MLYSSYGPTLREWIALIQQDAIQAEQILISIKVRNKQLGLMADPSLQMSIEDYQRAQDLLSQATHDPQKAKFVAVAARLGQALMRPAPDRDGWLVLIADDPTFAQQLYGALQAKCARFGAQTPSEIIESINAYHTVKA